MPLPTLQVFGRMGRASLVSKACFSGSLRQVVSVILVLAVDGCWGRVGALRKSDDVKVARVGKLDPVAAPVN